MIVSYTFDFGDGSTITFQSNPHFKMIFVEMKGLLVLLGRIEGLLGSYESTGFVASEDGRRRMQGDNDVDAYGQQEWQVVEDEPKLFMLANIFP